MTTAAIELRGVRKAYGNVVALDDVSLTLHPGEVHALMGENGAGKSTLLKILAGVERPDRAELRVAGDEVDARSLTPSSARELGIAIVHQEFSLIPQLTVVENIFLGIEDHRLGVTRRQAMRVRAEELLARVNARHIAPTRLVSELSVADCQLVEIAKALAGDVRVLALDEPSAVLSGDELQGLFDVVRTLAADGVGVLYVSHRMEEVFTLCDRYTVLKDGANSGEGMLADIDTDGLISLMVGRSVSQLFPPSTSSVGEPLLRAEQLLIDGLAEPLDLELRAGEIVGLAGLQGSGRTRLGRGLFGDVAVVGGQLEIRGRQSAGMRSPAEAIRNRIAYLPEDRKNAGLALDASIAENIGMLSWRRIRTPFGLISRRGERASVAEAISRLRIKTDPSGRARARTLSGGNQQKVVIAKWLDVVPEVLIFDEPTRGIDVGAKEHAYAILRELADSGKAILLISSELIEVIGLSDRILVMADGRIAGSLPGRTTTEEDIMHVIATARRSHGEVA